MSSLEIRFSWTKVNCCFIPDRTTGESSAIDAREVAPLAATTDMFYNGTSSSKGNLFSYFYMKTCDAQHMKMVLR